MDILSSLQSRLSQAKQGFTSLVGNALKGVNSYIDENDKRVAEFNSSPIGKVNSFLQTPMKPARYVAEEIVRKPLMQAGAQIATTLMGQDDFKPSDFGALGKKIYGGGDVMSLNKVAQSGPITKWAEDKGVSPNIAVPLSFIGATGLAVSDLTPLGGGKKKVAEKISSLAPDAVKVAKSALGAVDEVVDTETAVRNVMKALKEAGPIRGAQEAAYTANRAKRIAMAERAGMEAGGGLAGFEAEKRALSGAMDVVDYTPLKISQGDMDGVFRAVSKSDKLHFLEKITAKNALADLFGLGGGKVPTESGIEALRKALSPEFVEEVLNKRTNLQKAYEAGVSVLNVPRALMSSFDLSAPLRQGVFLVGRPKQWLPAFRDMFKYAFDEKAYQNLGADIASRANYSRYRDMKLAITDMGGISTREEAFMSNLAEKIPGIGKIVKGSNRAYSGFLTKLRVDVADDLIKNAEKLGVNVQEGSKALKDIGSFVNTATGRGGLGGGSLEKAAPLLNSVFFSPRLMASRINLLNPAYYYRLDPFVRKEALKSLFTFAATGATVLGLAKLVGGDKVEIGDDPRSADFGKIKVGNTRYDIFGGFQQYIKLAAQLSTGEMVSTTTGEKYKIKSALQPDVPGFKPTTALDITSRFFEQKESPLMSFATGLARGENSMGEEFNIPDEIKSRFIPMILQDLTDLYKEGGIPAVIKETPGIFGVGTQTYTTKPKGLTPTKPSSTSRLKSTSKLRKPGPSLK